MAPSPVQVPLLAIARLSLLTLLWFPSAGAQYRFDSWTTDNGLPQNSISSIIQTRDGYLWLTTFDGLVRFNGVQFKVFDKSNTKGISTNRALFWRRWWFWLLCSIAVIGVAAFAITRRLIQLKRKQLEREAFSRKLIESQEGERKRLAGELHDSLGQNLLIVKNWALIGLNSLAQDNPAREHLTEISDTTSLAIDEVREISHNLRPQQLERLGLTTTIEQMVRQIRNSTNIEFMTETDNIDGLLSKESEINLYRVLQECLNNILKHSKTTKAWLSIKRTANGAEIICRDNGKGFDADTTPLTSGMGLIGMAERVRILGGRYTLDSAIGRGVTIRVSIRP